MKYFKVKVGYGDKEPIIIDENELPLALNAQVYGGIAVFQNGSVAGNYITEIVPDLSKAKKNYDPEIGEFVSKRTESEYQLALENAKEIVMAKKEGRTPQLKEPSLRIHTQGLTAIGDILKK